MAHTAFTPLRPRALALAASTLALSAAPAAADTAPAAPLVIAPRAAITAVATTALPADTVLKRLPGGQEQLTFRGEMASRRFPVVVGRSEAAHISTFQVALRNTVSLLPEHSAVTVGINGRTLATLPASAADKLAILPVAIPPGLLVPGVNTVQITSRLTHRVDCSVPATYELWATLDPAQTGFLAPRTAIQPINTVADLAAAPLAEDGTTRIRVRMADDADETALSQAARAVQILVSRAKLVRPVVELGSAPGDGSGLDLVVDGHEPEGFVPLAKSGGIGVDRDAASGRIAVEVDPAEDAQGPSPADRGGPAAAEPQHDGFRQTFAQLGMGTDVFTGRRYEASFPVLLPSDFMSTKDRAHLRLDGGHGATLVEGDGLAVRVNGALVSFVPLAAGKSERFDHREVELPLRFFHPGHNDVAIEGTLSAEADAECKTATMPREARLTIADTSELEFPGFAHLTTLPQIPAAMAPQGDLPVYLPGADAATLGAGLTVLANMAAEGRLMANPRVHLGSVDDAAPGLLVAVADQLPPTVSSALRRITEPAAGPATASGTPTEAATPQTGDTSAGAGATPPAEDGWRPAALVKSLASVLRSRGFFFGSDQADKLALKTDDVLVAAVAPDGKAPRGELDVLPRFVKDSTHWLVATAGNSGALDAGLRQLAVSGRWNELRGEAVRFDPTNGTVEVRQPRAVTYVLPSDVAPSDIRPIIGGLMSDNIVMSLAVLVLLMAVLGLSTHALVRRMGVK